MASNLRVWCDRLLGLTFEVRWHCLICVLAHILQDPSIKQRVIQLAVGFASGPLKREPRFAFKVFDYMLDIRCPEYPGCRAYTDAVRDLQQFSLHQLQRIAMRFPNDLAVG